MQANGGFLSYDDLASHHGEWVQPVSTTYRGVQLWELPPNGQGIAALQMLNILEGFDFTNIPFDSAERIHLVTEAQKLAFADRDRYYADPALQATTVDTSEERRVGKEVDRARTARGWPYTKQQQN